MYLHIAEPKTAEQFVARLRETEKIQIRLAANADALEHMRQTSFAYDMLTPEAMAKAQELVFAEFRSHDSNPRFGQTWKI